MTRRGLLALVGSILATRGALAVDPAVTPAPGAKPTGRGEITFELASLARRRRGKFPNVVLERFERKEPRSLDAATFAVTFDPNAVDADDDAARRMLRDEPYINVGKEQAVRVTIDSIRSSTTERLQAKERGEKDYVCRRYRGEGKIVFRGKKHHFATDIHLEDGPPGTLKLSGTGAVNRRTLEFGPPFNDKDTYSPIETVRFDWQLSIELPS